MVKCIDNCYFEVEISNWNGGDHTWYTYKIFKNSKNAYDFMRAHQNQICKDHIAIDDLLPVLQH